MTTDYNDWTISDVYWKSESEGGIAELINWGGTAVFTALGPDAVEAAKQIEQGIELIQRIFDAQEDLFDGDPF
jgi:hypothetical protein